MKNRILTFVIGILVGAILTTIGFLVYTNSVIKNPNQMMNRFQNNGQFERPNGNMGEPPEKPQGDFNQNMNNN